MQNHWELPALTPWTVLGAALLGSIGAAFLYRPERSWHQHSTYFDDSFSEVETIDGDAMRMESSFGSSIKYINSEDFRGAGIHCSFGAMKVYFDHAEVPQGRQLLSWMFPLVEWNSIFHAAGR